MKLIWSPEAASKAYLDTVKSCQLVKDSSVAELISAMASGWNAQLIVETWSKGGPITTSIGLCMATRHTKGRHVCIVPDQESRSQYLDTIQKYSVQSSTEVKVGRPEEVVKELEDGIDFLVVDCKQDEFARILRVAKLGHRGAVLVCKNASSRGASDFRWQSALDEKSRIVRSVFLPVGNGLDIAYIGGEGGGRRGKGKSRWIKHVNTASGEEFVIRT